MTLRIHQPRDVHVQIDDSDRAHYAPFNGSPRVTVSGQERRGTTTLFFIITYENRVRNGRVSPCSMNIQTSWSFFLIMMRPSKLLRRGARTREREKGDTMEREGRMSERERETEPRVQFRI